MPWFTFLWFLMGIAAVVIALYLAYRGLTDDEFGINRY